MAVSNRTRFFFVPHLFGKPVENFADYRARLTTLKFDYTRARSRKPNILESMGRLIDEANRYAEFYGLRSRLQMPEDLDKLQEECRAITAREEKREQARKRKLALAEAKRQEERLERLTQWANGADIDPPYTDLIRLRIRGDQLETSHGACVPLEHAIKAFRIILECRETARAYTRNGHTIHLGHFAIDRIDERGNVWAGCHYVEWAEIANVAAVAESRGLLQPVAHGIVCPKCSKQNWEYLLRSPIEPAEDKFQCRECGEVWQRYNAPAMVEGGAQ